MPHILGHHHLSMIVKDAKETNYFYKHILGLRRVKMTVNQDDPSMYHLFYGDKFGTAGTELTFFEIPLAGQTYRGTNAINRIGLFLPSEKSLIYWKERLNSFNIPLSSTSYVNRPALHFTDPDGLQLVFLVEEQSLDGWGGWDKSPVPIHNQIRGVGPIEINVRRMNKFDRTLRELFSYVKVDDSSDGRLYRPPSLTPYGEIVVKELDDVRERPGRGSIHHLAIRVKNEEALHYWDEKIRERGFITTGLVDRYYFKSLYFRESNGIMIELATDGPGFMTDETLDHLGESIALPPFLEGEREKIEQALSKIEDV